MVEWEDKFSVGNSEIDEQHKKLVDMVNELSESINKYHGDEKLLINHLLDELFEYTSFHFSSEEEAMRKSSFPELDNHIQIHKDLVNQLVEKRERLLNSGVVTILEMAVFLEDWLVDHILYEDMKYKEYV